jgi:Ca2+-binding EF-hand superfamily protein
MRATTGLAAAALGAIVAAALTTALPATARGPGDGMMPGMHGMHGMMEDGPFGEAGFAMFDTNGDGSITIEELTARRAEMVAGTDANKDGKLCAEELAAQEMKMMQQVAAAHAAMKIEMLDVDGDGLLSVEELAVRPMPAMMFERLDADNDSVVTREEADQARARMAEHGGRGDGPRGHRKAFGMGDDN